MKQNPLKNIDGVRIRRQYFNFPIYILLCLWLSLIDVFTFLPLCKGNFSFHEWGNDMFMSACVMAMFILPCLVLSALNRFFFGKLVCVLSEEGIHYKDGLIKWDNISHIKYTPTVFGRHHFWPANMDVVCKNETINIVSVPLYMFPAVKKFCPDIKTKMDKTFFTMLAILLITFTIILIICTKYPPVSS